MAKAFENCEKWYESEFFTIIIELFFYDPN